MPSEMMDVFTPKYLRMLNLFRLHARKAFLGTRQGGHLSPKRGHGIEFSDYRQYELGDNPRHIDWGLYGRTERLYVKRFQEEQDLQVLIAVDASASMAAAPQDLKWDRAREIALSLGYIALMSQDAVSMVALGSQCTPSLSGPKAFQHLLRYMRQVTPGGRGDFFRDLQSAAARVRFPGVAVVVSDCLIEFDQIEAGLNVLRSKNLDITLIQVLGTSDRSLSFASGGAVLHDSESAEEVSLVATLETEQEYRKALQQHCEQIEAFCGGARIGYALALPEEELGTWMQEALPAIGVLG